MTIPPRPPAPSPALVTALKNAATDLSAELSEITGYKITVTKFGMASFPNNDGPQTQTSRYTMTSPGAETKRGAFVLHSSVSQEPSTSQGSFQNLLRFWTNRGDRSATGRLHSLNSATVPSVSGAASGVSGPTTHPSAQPPTPQPQAPLPSRFNRPVTPPPDSGLPEASMQTPAPPSPTGPTAPTAPVGPKYPNVKTLRGLFDTKPQPQRRKLDIGFKLITQDSDKNSTGKTDDKNKT